MAYADIASVICDLCREDYLTKERIIHYIGKSEFHVKEILARMVEDKLLVRKYPEMKKHPNQAYRTA